MRSRDIENKIAFATLLIVLLISSSVGSVQADGTTQRRAIIIVSSFDESENEEGKAVSLYEHLIEEGYAGDDIEFLAFQSTTYADNISATDNIEAAFCELINDNSPDKEVLVYISDHMAPLGENNSIFRFEDGNITAEQIDQWIENITFSQLDVIVCGNYSGSVGPELSEPDRKIMCSMGSEEENDPDLFNITRGLNDTTADTNCDGEVSFEEAFWSEYYTVIDHGQTPCIWG